MGAAIKCRAQALPTALQALTPALVELYGGYGYFRPLSGTVAMRRYDAIQPGVVVSGTYFFSRYLGVQAEGAAFPRGRNDSVGTIEAGPEVRYPYGRLTPFVHVLGGVVRQRGPVSEPPTYGWGAMGGAGLDYVVRGLQDRFAIRVIEADFDYTHVNIGTTSLPGESANEIKAYRLSAGVMWRFGSRAPQRERLLLYGCAASPTAVYAGDPVTVTGTAGGALTGKPVAYTWVANGGEISATEETANVATAGLAAGEYTVIGHIVQGKHAHEVAECMTGFKVRPPEPPTVSCSANPVSVAPGGEATITSQANSPQNRPLTYSYTASAGDIAGMRTVATLNARDAPPGPIDVECTVRDDLGQSATAMAVLNVVAPPLPAAPQSRELCTLNFGRDRRRPVQVDKEAKACLDDAAQLLNDEPMARLEIMGERTKDEAAGQAAARALNARRYLTKEKGIDPARIDIRTGKMGSRTAQMELLRPGFPIHNRDGSGGPQAAPIIGPIKGEDRAPAATPEERADPAPAEGAGGAGEKLSPGSQLLLMPGDTVAKSGASARSQGVHPRKRRRRHKATAVATGTPPGTSGAK